MRRHIRAERVKLPRVHREVKGGRVYKCHRITRGKLPTDVPEDHPAFLAAWAAEDAKRPEPKTRGAPGSVDFVWSKLKATAEFKSLSAGYKRVVMTHGDAIAMAYGKAPFKGLRSNHIEKDLSGLAPHAANARLKTWRLLAKLAKKIGAADIVATDGLTKRKAPKAESHAPWTAAEVATFRKRWPIDSAPGRAFELLYWTAARTNDAVRLGRSFIGSDGLLTYRQSKTKNPAHVPWTSPLPIWARQWADDRDRAIEAAGKTGFTFLEVNGRQRSAKGLSNVISAAAKSAGILNKTAHGLRATRLTLIAEASGMTTAIMSWGGHVTLQEAEHYTRQFARRAVLIGTEQVQNPVERPAQNL